MYSGNHMVGQSSMCLNNSGCCKYISVITVFILIGIILGNCTVSADTGSSVRLVVYSEPNETGGYNPVPPLELLPQNFSYSLRSTSLGFVVVETETNLSEYITNELLNLPWVYAVESDPERTAGSVSRDDQITNSSPDQWAFSRIGVDEIPRGKNLSPCSVAIIDTGIDESHPDMGVIGRGYDWTGQDSKPEDADGHGTALGGIVSHIAGDRTYPENSSALTIIPERIGMNGTQMTASHSALAISHAADNGADIILMGYGGAKQSLAEERAVLYAAQKGCLLIASAGNDDSNTMHYPSDNFDVISVGSIAKSDGLSYFSNYGIYTELVAPGEDVISSCPNRSYCRGSGTSFAAAEVAGIAALVHETYPSLSSSEIRQILQSSATDLGRCGRDIYYGYGIPTIPETVTAAEGLTLQKILKSFSEGEQIRELRRSKIIDNTTTHSLSLGRGWNFISLPAPLMSRKTCKDLFSKVNTDGHTIWTYTRREDGWIAYPPDDTPTPGQGILVYSYAAIDIPLVFDKPKNSQVNLSKGWNLIGSGNSIPIPARNLSCSDNFSWVSILPFNASRQQYDPAIIRGSSGQFTDNRTIEPYSAIWIYLDADGIFIPSSEV